MVPSPFPFRGAEDPHEHNYTETVTAPTCTEEGYTTYTCECGEYYVGNKTAATGHNYENNVCTACGKDKLIDMDITKNADDYEKIASPDAAMWQCSFLDLTPGSWQTFTSDKTIVG